METRSENRNLAELFKEKVADPKRSPDYTWDDFFDEIGIKVENRSNFLIGCILKQAYPERFREVIQEAEKACKTGR